MKTNTIIQGDCLSVLKTFPDEFVDCVICSPPYWGLRDYGIDSIIWDGDKDCKHNFNIETKTGDIRFRGSGSDVGNWENPDIYIGDGKGSYCSKCGAWKGSLGLEPTFELYIKHLCNIFDEIKRVLKPTGTCWVNMGDTYGTISGGMEQLKKMGKGTPQYGAIPYADGYEGVKQTGKKNMQMNKCLCQIPQRFSIEMTNPNWVLRDDISEEEKKYVLTELGKYGII